LSPEDAKKETGEQEKKKNKRRRSDGVA